MIEKHIVLEDVDPVMFYGVNNAHLQMIKSLYPKLRIVARDNVLRVLGDEEEMAKAEEEIERMRIHLLKYNTLTEEDILDIVKGKQTKADTVKEQTMTQYSSYSVMQKATHTAGSTRAIRLVVTKARTQLSTGPRLQQRLWVKPTGRPSSTPQHSLISR
mgnify:CR=1 FL=1